MLFAEVGRHLLSESHGLSGRGVGTSFEDRPLCFPNIASALQVDVGLPGRSLAHIASFPLLTLHTTNCPQSRLDVCHPDPSSASFSLSHGPALNSRFSPTPLNSRVFSPL